MISFKSRGLEIQWKTGKLDEMLRLLVCEAACWLAQRGHTLTITSLYREGMGPHGDTPCRAADIRIRDLPDEITDALVDYLNGTFPWPISARHAAPIRPTAIHETVGPTSRATGPHIHIQVPRAELGDTGWAPVLSPWDQGDRQLL